MRVLVWGGYSPDVIVIKRGIPVRMDSRRDETAECPDTIVFGELDIKRSLFALKTTPIEFTSEKAGEFTLSCGMGIIRGKLIAE